MVELQEAEVAAVPMEEVAEVVVAQAAEVALAATLVKLFKLTSKMKCIAGMLLTLNV